MPRLRAALAFLITLPTGCASIAVVPVDCEEEHRVGDVCAGVPPGPVCDEDYWTEGVPCAVVHQVDSGASFAAAVGSAQAGSCIALAPGAYGSVILPPGVSLLGGGADCVTLAGIEVSGEGVVVRGVTITAGSLQVRDGSTTAEMIRIVDSLEDLCPTQSLEAPKRRTTRNFAFSKVWWEMEPTTTSKRSPTRPRSDRLPQTWALSHLNLCPTQSLGAPTTTLKRSPTRPRSGRLPTS
jgi:hypothetical protein